MGPGAYTIQSTIGDSQKAVLASRTQFAESKDTNPGVGSYNIAPKKNTAPSANFEGRYVTKDVRPNIAPGEYNVVSEFDKNKKNKVGAKFNSRREQRNPLDANPGPNAYAPSLKVVFVK